jgi:hypothetical protein
LRRLRQAHRSRGCGAGSSTPKSTPDETLRRIGAIMLCRERLAANVHSRVAVEAMMVAPRS